MVCLISKIQSWKCILHRWKRGKEFSLSFAQIKNTKTERTIEKLTRRTKRHDHNINWKLLTVLLQITVLDYYHVIVLTSMFCLNYCTVYWYCNRYRYIGEDFTLSALKSHHCIIISKKSSLYRGYHYIEDRCIRVPLYQQNELF